VRTLTLKIEPRNYGCDGAGSSGKDVGDDKSLRATANPKTSSIDFISGNT